MQPLPTALNRAQHAHGFDDLHVLQVAAEFALGLHVVLLRLVQGGFGQLLVQPGDGNQHQRPGQRECRSLRRERRNDQEIQRGPRRIKYGNQTRAGQCLTQGREVMQGLGAAVAGLAEHALIGRAQNPQAHQMVQPGTHPHQHPGADSLQRCHEQKGTHYQQGEDEQGGFVAAAQHPVVHLHHVERRRQHHQVQEPAEHRHRHKRRAELAQRVPQLVRGCRRGGSHEGVGTDRAGSATILRTHP